MYLCDMNQMLMILTQRELFLLIIGALTYMALFVVTWQNSRRKVLSLQERLDKVRAMQVVADVEANRQKIEELERLIQKLGSENSLLRLELEEKKAKLDYANTMARIESEKRERAEGDIFRSEVYLRIQRLAAEGRSMGEEDWQDPRPAQGYSAAHGPFQGERLYQQEPALSESVWQEGIGQGLGRFPAVDIIYNKV